MLGKIVLEEASERAEADFLSDTHDIGYTIVSLPVPGILSDKALAGNTPPEANNWTADQIKKQPRRHGRACRLSMHDPKQTDQELRRCVQELGSNGALLCDFQHSGPNGETDLYYDQPAYDEFQNVLTELDVNLYIHPAAPSDVILHWLDSERRLRPPPEAEDHRRLQASTCSSTSDITTSGHLSTATLKYVVNEIGADRFLFSVGYPYETIENGCGWWDNDSKAIQVAVGGVDASCRIRRKEAAQVGLFPRLECSCQLRRIPMA
ncbi:hypothetical protein PENARI_c001G10645 [Penicillium arizonense]|uniref:Amidohydrolase-related domain-containing protein n=1 Tax=Penicillium arizonense TaxID=1835702 RepID=A0A1F5LZN4_PENAI|nr:hypothetical protein PENARI_c001G10645 [Penicillium arizonense]OGE58499.1 hypothetical protein PENARI_c001G10645 [Penicillium arizonense]